MNWTGHYCGCDCGALLGATVVEIVRPCEGRPGVVTVDAIRPGHDIPAGWSPRGWHAV